MTTPRDPKSEHAQVLISGVPTDLLRWFDMEAFNSAGGKRGGRKLGSGRSGLIVKAMDFYRTEKKRRQLQNKERAKAKKSTTAAAE